MARSIRPPSGGNPGGSNTYVQFNDDGEFGGSGSLLFDKDTETLDVMGLRVFASAQVSGGVYVADEAYSPTSWNGNLSAPTKNAVRDKIESLSLGGGTPGGLTTQIQFNDGGVFGGDAGLTYNKTTDVLTVAGSVIVPDVVYGAGWNGDFSVPTKNAVYDKIETVVAGGGSGLTIDDDGTTEVSNVTWITFNGNEFNVVDSGFPGIIGIELDYGTTAGKPAEGSHSHINDHAPATVSDTSSINMTISGQDIRADAIFGTTPTTIAIGNHLHNANYQPLDDGLTQIAGLTDPGADRILFWQESVNSYAYLIPGAGLTITGSYLDAGGTPGGATTQLQFNDAGVFGGDSDLTWNKTTNLLSINGLLKWPLGTTGLKLDFLAGESGIGLETNEVRFGVYQATGKFGFRTGGYTGTELASLATTGIILNVPAGDTDTIIKGVSDANLIHTDASTDRVGIGTATPGQKLQVVGNVMATDLILGSPSAVAGSIRMANSTNISARNFANTADVTIARVDSTNYVYYGPGLLVGISPSGVLVADKGMLINATSIDSDTQISGDTDVNTFYLDASTDRVGIGTASPAAKLDVVGNIGVSGKIDFAETTGLKVDMYAGGYGMGVEGGETRFSVLNMNDKFGFRVGGYSGTELASLSTAGIILNAPAGDTDTQIKGDTDANLLYVDASTDRVGIGMAAPAEKLDVTGNAIIGNKSNPKLHLRGTDGISAEWAFYNSEGGGMLFANDNVVNIARTNSSGTWTANLASFDASSQLTVNNLAGTGTRMVTASSTGLLSTAALGASTPGGSDTQVQFNDGGVMGADAGITYNKATDVLTVANTIALGGTPAASGTIRIPNASNISGRNQANSADVTIARVDSTNYVYYGPGLLVGISPSGVLVADKGASFNATSGDFDVSISGDTDTSLFYTDASTDRVGIGTATPAQKLDVQGSVSIGTTTPAVITNNAISTSNGLLALYQTGDTYGETRLTMLNRVSMNGVLLEQKSATGAAGLLDLIMDSGGTGTPRRNIRMENRAGSTFLAAPEFQFGPAGNPSLVTADAGASVRGTFTVSGVVTHGNLAGTGIRPIGASSTGVLGPIAYGTTAGTVSEGNHGHTVTETWAIPVGDGVNVIPTGIYTDWQAGFAGTLTAWRILPTKFTSGTTGSVVFDIWATTYAGGPPVVGNSISTSKPTLTTANKAEDTTITDWTEAFSAGTWFRLNVDSAATVTLATLILEYTRTV